MGQIERCSLSEREWSAPALCRSRSIPAGNLGSNVYLSVHLVLSVHLKFSTRRTSGCCLSQIQINLVQKLDVP